MTPEWKKAATALKGVIKVGAVDADAHRELGSRFGVKGGTQFSSRHDPCSCEL